MHKNLDANKFLKSLQPNKKNFFSVRSDDIYKGSHSHTYSVPLLYYGIMTITKIDDTGFASRRYQHNVVVSTVTPDISLVSRRHDYIRIMGLNESRRYTKSTCSPVWLLNYSGNSKCVVGGHCSDLWRKVPVSARRMVSVPEKYQNFNRRQQSTSISTSCSRLHAMDRLASSTKAW